jgi:hypothetical protein
MVLLSLEKKLKRESEKSAKSVTYPSPASTEPLCLAESWRNIYKHFIAKPLLCRAVWRMKK